MPMVDPARLCAASAQETTGPIHSTAHRPTELPASSASCQKINKLPASNISTCPETESIYATSSRLIDGACHIFEYVYGSLVLNGPFGCHACVHSGPRVPTLG